MFLGLAPGAAAAATPGLELHFERTAGEWGRPLRGQVLYRGAHDPGDFDFSRWHALVHVEPGYAAVSELPQGGLERRQTVRLYPRSTGRLLLPALVHGGWRSEPLALEIAVPEVDGRRLRLVSGLTDDRVSVGEQFSLALRLDNAGDDARIELDPFEAAGARALVLPARPARGGNDGETTLALGWSLHPASRGIWQIALPPVRYVRHGRDLLRFYLPLIALTVEPLPAYVPLSVPVGRIAIDSTLERGGASPHWRVQVRSDGRLPAGWPELEGALADLAGIEPDRLPREVAEGVEGATWYQEVEYRVPLPDWLVPLGGGPRFEVQYFDPDARRVIRLAHALPAAWRLPAWFLGLPAVVLIAALAPLLTWLWRRLQHWRARRRLLARLAAAGDPGTLRRILLEGFGCRTLGGWAEAHPDPAVARAADALNAACFSREAGPLDPADLRQTLAVALKRARVA
jgi:hypothetical protein